MSSTILPLFSQLWAHNSDIRIAASAKLVHTLQGAQAVYIQEGTKNDTPSASTSNAINAINASTSSQFHGLANDVNYSLKRLIRGLASPRDSSRLGFAVALTELLTRLDNISVRDVLPVLLSNSQPSSSAKGSEERDLLFARLFGLHSLIASGLLFKSDNNSSTIHDWRTVIEELLVLGEKKVWLRESSGWIVQNATKILMSKRVEEVEWKEEGLKVVLQAAFDTSLSGENGKTGNRKKNSPGTSAEWTLERLALVILLQESSSSANFEWETMLKSTFPDVSLLSSSKNIPALTRLLRGSSNTPTQSNNDATAQSLFGTGGLHYVWNELLEAYFPAQLRLQGEEGRIEQPSKKKAKVAKGQQQQKQEKVPFVTLYKAVVEDALLGTTSSLASKYIGLQILSLALTKISASTSSSIPASPIPSLITPNLLRTLINHLSKKDRTLHGIALQASLSIPLAVKSSPEIGYDVLLRVLSKKNGGNIRFDSVTKTKTVEGIVEHMDQKSVDKYTEWLMSFIVNAGEENSEKEGDEEMQVDNEAEDEEQGNEVTRSKRSENERAWAMDQLLLIIRKHYSSSSAAPKTADFAPASPSSALPLWCISILQFLSLHGFFSLQKPSSKSLSMKAKPSLLKPFTPSTQGLFRTRFFSALTHILTGIAPKNVSLQKEVVECVRKECFDRFEGDQKHVRILSAVEEDVKERKMTYKLLERVQGTPDKSRSDAISLLVQVLLLQAYSPETGSTDGLEQVRDAVKALFFPSASTSKVIDKEEEEDDNGVEAEPISILIDLLVDILQKPAVLTRTVAERVFTAFSGEVKEQALQLLLDQISPEDEPDMVEDEEDEEDEEDDDEEDGAEASQTNGKSKKGKQVAEEDSDSSSEDDSNDEDDDEDLGINLDVDPELRDKVAAALASMGVGADEEDDEDAEDEEEEEEEPDLNDDQMMELDEQLAEIFRSRKAAAKDSKDAVQNSLNARLRILDLLDLYAKNQASNPLILHTILPLLSAARQADGQEDELAAKAIRVLLSMSKPKEYPEISETAPVLTMLSSIHAIARRHSRAELAEIFSSTSLLLSRIILTSSENRNVTDVADIYTATLTDYLSRKSSKIQANFFSSFIKRFRNAAWGLNDPLIEACSEESITDNKDKRMQCFSMLGDLLTSHASLKTKDAYDNIVTAMPRIVEMVANVFQAAADGKGLKLEINRLREIFKFCTQAIRATRIALNGRAEPSISSIWRSEELERVWNAVMASSNIEKGATLAPQIKNLLASVKQGSGQPATVKKALQQKPVVSEKKAAKKQKRKAGEMEGSAITA